MDSPVKSADEVKKLQDLVKKLEKQNELLRSKADGTGFGSHEREELSPSRKHPDPDGATRSKKTETCSTNNLLESVKLLDLNLLEDDDDTWLYTSPIKAPTPEQKNVDPKEWVRQDFENPDPDEKMKSAKKALLAKLDEVSRANRNSMGPNAFVAPSQVSALLSQQLAAAAAAPSPPVATPVVPINHSPLHSPSHSPSHSKSSSVTNINNVVDSSLGVGILDTSPISSPPNTPSRRERKSSEERLSFAKLEDVTDVQILAKMQEDSLRQATQQSPANSPRRVLASASSDQALHRAVSRTSSQGSMCSDKDEMDGDFSPRQTTTGVVRRRPSLERLRKNPETGNKKAKRHTSSLPNLNRTSPVKANSKLKTSPSDVKKNRLKQPNSTPRQRSPISAVNNNNKIIEKVKGHSGSLPNLNRTYTAQPNSNLQSGSTENVDQHQPPPPKVKQPNSVSMKRSPTSTPNSKSALRQPSPTKLRAASPSRSGIPVRLGLADRSAIPRPRSAIISPRSQMMHPSTLPRASVQTMNRTVTRSKDDSWREGCY